MTILHIHDKARPIGGVQAYVRRLRAAQADAGHRSVVLRLVKGARPGREGTDDRICATAPAPFGRSSAGRRILDLVRSEDPDVVHVHSVFTALGPPAIRGIHALKPTVYTLHDVRPLYFWGLSDPVYRDSPDLARFIHGSAADRAGTTRVKGMLLAASRRRLLGAYRRLDRMIVANTFFRDELSRRGFDDSQVALIPLFVETPPASSSAPPGPVVLFVGRLSAEKGILEFVRMLGLLRDDGWQALVVGDGPLRSEAERLARERGLQAKIRFIPALPPDELGQTYAACRVLVVPSLIPENFGLAGLEALAAGRPVVAFRQPGITEWLRDAVDGFLVPPGDLQALGARVQSLLDAPETAVRLGARGRDIAAEEFGPERHLKLLQAVYERAMRRAA